MSKGRVEAFSDGVIAILITIMVLELRLPGGTELQDLAALVPVLVSYVLSFLNLGIYWNNHHHLLQAARVIDGRVLWANLHLLFWLSLVPFGTRWMGEHEFAPVPTAAYGVILLASGIAFFILVRVLVSCAGQSPTLAEALGDDRKGAVSPFIYVAAIPIALVAPLVAFAMYVVVAMMWFVPDRRIERQLSR